MKKFLTNIANHLPLGLTALMLAGFVYGNMDPSLELHNYGSTPFFIGCGAYLIAIFTLIYLVGSLRALILSVSPKTPTLLVYVIWAFILTSSGLVWGAAANFMFSIFENATATSYVEIKGEFLHYEKWGSRNSCQEKAIFLTAYGEIGVCAMGHSSNFKLGTLFPESLKSGDEVVFVGKKNSMVFVLKKIKFDGQ